MADKLQFQIQDSAFSLEFLKETFEFSNNTAQVIKDSFGPNGLDILLSTSSGTLLLTNDGFQVIKSLSASRPVGKLIFQGLTLFYKNAGDFSKKFILLLREFLWEVLDIVSSVDKSSSSEQILCISQGLDELLHKYILQEVFNQLQAMGVIHEFTEKIEDLPNFFTSVMKSSVIGKFSPKTCEIFISLLQQLFDVEETSNDVEHLKQRTEKLLDDFSNTVWEVPGKALAFSTVIPGIIIPREFSTIIKKLPKSFESNSFKFVILASCHGYDLPRSAAVLSLKHSQHVDHVLRWRKQHIENLVKTLAQNKVELIITSTKLHETFVHICNQYHMAAIHLVSHEDILRISDAVGIHPLTELSCNLTQFIGVATSCKPIQVGQHVYTHLQLTKMFVKSMVLYAPTGELCHQYSVGLQNMLKILRSSFKQCPDKSWVVSYVPGGGTFELALANKLEEYRNLCKLNPNTMLACEILEKALLSVPRKLAENSNSNLSTFDLRAKTRHALAAGEPVCGLERNGKLGFLINKGVIEPTMANYHLVSSVIQLVIQILRTDKVIHVKTLPKKSVEVDSEGSDTDENM
ncbi:T-complex protein 1 subunit alpha-like [Dendronephthya gigantea]|uniref:T-complex protein 1 subunit alpha-like n=1 Tax=Dendronephthya gigantea TaxID=151771 RepID=UPI00106B65A6|nr:T-complex protein 1 subunit alpha-like [Dendronephthya gigantea]